MLAVTMPKLIKANSISLILTVNRDQSIGSPVFRRLHSNSAFTYRKTSEPFLAITCFSTTKYENQPQAKYSKVAKPLSEK